MKFITHEDPYEVTTKNHGKVTVPAGALEFPQVESLTEVVEFGGGGDETKVVELFNDLIYTRSKNGALAIIRNAPAGAEGGIGSYIEKAKTYSKSYNPAAERVSKAAILEGVDKIREAKEAGTLSAMSQEELLALLENTLRI